VATDVQAPVAEIDSASVDGANRRFYSRFPYPEPPMTFPRLEDRGFDTVMLNQSLGDFSHRTIPRDARIWVAGCGTNQAIYTALAFPDATIVASDLSPAALELSRRHALSLGIDNLSLRQESLNEVRYQDDFDYIICTGVIHHTADPAKALANVARALRRTGVLELMVYNRFHRTFTTAFQEAVRTLAAEEGGEASYQCQMHVARALLEVEPLATRPDVKMLHGLDDAAFADLLIQPVERSYSVEGLAALAAGCGLELTLPRLSRIDRIDGHSWTLGVRPADLRDRIHQLPDIGRWHVVNLLRLERSPMLWFFARHRSPSGDGRYERRVNEAFLDRPFVRAATRLRNYLRQADGTYTPASVTVPYPPPPDGDLIRSVLRQADGRRPLAAVLSEAGVDVSNHDAVSDVRIQLTTSLCPYLRAA